MQRHSRKAKVVLYSTQHCPHCQHAKRWLKENNIPFLDFNVAKPGKIQKQFFALGGHSVPLFVIGDYQLSGFNLRQIKSVLTKMGLLPADASSPIAKKKGV
jgi:glutaredoxin